MSVVRLFFHSGRSNCDRLDAHPRAAVSVAGVSTGETKASQRGTKVDQISGIP